MFGRENLNWSNRDGGHGKSRRRVSERAKAPAVSTGSEAVYLRLLVDSGATVTVLLTSGEELVGKVRYYDRDCISLGLAPRGPNVLVRKDQVLLLREQSQQG